MAPRRNRRRALTVAFGASGRTDARRSDPDETRPGARRGPVPGKQRPAVLVILFLIFMTGSAVALFAQGGHLERRRLEAIQGEANLELDSQLRRVHALRTEVDRLSRDSLARERLAREELGYSRKGEVIFLLAEPPARP